MLSLAPPVVDVVSPKVYGLILDSKRLAAKLLPQGLVCSPYEILDYRATLILADPNGHRATFHRTQQVRFLQDGVEAILDHLWGDGVTLTHYHTTAGPLGESFKDRDIRHLVINLGRPMGHGDRLTFEVERTAMLGFTEADEWLETTIDHPIGNLGKTIVFPRERPCQRAELVVQGGAMPLEPHVMANGRTVLRLAVPDPAADTPYTIRWTW